jgi:hypothetical protein
MIHTDFDNDHETLLWQGTRWIISLYKDDYTDRGDIIIYHCNYRGWAEWSGTNWHPNFWNHIHPPTAVSMSIPQHIKNKAHYFRRIRRLL